MKLKTASQVETAPVAALGLLGGYVVARESGLRPLGGVVLGLAGLYVGRTWLTKGGGIEAAALGALYVGGFGLSHPLAKKIGAWPSVASVSALSAAASHVVIDRR